MNIIFVSNYFNHHQKYLSDRFHQICSSYVFIATSKMREERKNLGYGSIEIPEYVIEYRKDIELQIIEMINSCDVLIFGSAPLNLIRERIKKNKLIFKYSERPFKVGDNLWTYLPRFIKWHIENPVKKSIYMLCASAYTSYDYSKYFIFRRKTYKWGYFPETKKYSTDILFNQKKRNKILWCGRFLDWKHPEYVIEVAKRLKNECYDFEINFIGTGILEENLKQKVLDYGLEDYVLFLGSMKPEQVREHMELAGIYLFTSDRQEGWGAVLNESMNSGCAVVASHEIGAVPYLLKNGENGLVYESGNIDMLFEKVKYLLDNSDEQERLGTAAYHTILDEWNGEVAAERFLNLAEHILNGETYPDLYESGPCSKAEIIKDNWFYE